MDWVLVLSIIAGLVTVIAGIVQVVQYLQDRRKKALEKEQPVKTPVKGHSKDQNSPLRKELAEDTPESKHFVPGSPTANPTNPPILHNLPNADYGQFIGREAEIAKIHEILRPYPHSQHSVVTIDGIGGIGKSTLALEATHHYLRNEKEILPGERFDAIIWVSAKETILTAQGIKKRPQAFRTLEDIYAAIAITLERQDITKANTDEQIEIVRNVLTKQRTLLVIDNLETVDDEKVITFLRELPAPTKAIVTTRHRLDVAYPLRLKGLDEDEANRLILQESQKRNYPLSDPDAKRLYRYTGGVPLAIVWSIAQMSSGYSTEDVLRRLGDAHGDIAKFCFDESLGRIKNKPAYKTLIALSLFATDASREALGHVADLPAYDRDEGLVELENLSLVDRKGGRFRFLPITKSFALSELNQNQKLHLEMGKRWIAYLRELCSEVVDDYYWRHKSYSFYTEGENILEAINWATNYGSAEDVFELTYAAYDYSDIVGRWTELVELCDRAYKLAFSLKRNEAAQVAVARLPSITGWIFMQRGAYEKAEENFLQSLEQYREMGRDIGEAIALQHLSAIYRKTDRFDEAKNCNDQAWAIAERLDDGDLKALINTSYGKLARDLRDWQLSWEYFSKVQEWFEKRVEETPRDEPLARGTWGHLASIAYQLGRYAEAKDLCLKSLEYYEELGTKGYLATLKYRLALIESALGEYGSAIVHVQEAVDWFDRLGMKPDHVEAIKLLNQLESIK
jgi:tetratricopeptide (TPR) repeat protein